MFRAPSLPRDLVSSVQICGMKSFCGYCRLVGCFSWLTAAVLLVGTASLEAMQEDQFDMLQIGTRTYKNVTVTTKAKKYIFILHSAGMANIPVAELPAELRDRLGYKQPEKSKASTGSGAWAKTMAKLEVPQVKALEKQWQETLAGHSQEELRALMAANSRLILALAVGCLVFYLFCCNCCRLICQKTGNEPGVL